MRDEIRSNSKKLRLRCLRMRGSSLTPIRVNGIIPGNAQSRIRLGQAKLTRPPPKNDNSATGAPPEGAAGVQRRSGRSPETEELGTRSGAVLNCEGALLTGRQEPASWTDIVHLTDAAFIHGDIDGAMPLP
jgi:hypothetical protein